MPLGGAKKGEVFFAIRNIQKLQLSFWKLWMHQHVCIQSRICDSCHASVLINDACFCAAPCRLLATRHIRLPYPSNRLLNILQILYIVNGEKQVMSKCNDCLFTLRSYSSCASFNSKDFFEVGRNSQHKPGIFTVLLRAAQLVLSTQSEWLHK